MYMKINECFPLQLSVGNYFKSASLQQTKIHHCFGFAAPILTTLMHAYVVLQPRIVGRKSKDPRLMSFLPLKSQAPACFLDVSIDFWSIPSHSWGSNTTHLPNHPEVAGIINEVYNTTMNQSPGEEIKRSGGMQFPLVIHTFMTHRKWSSESS